MNECAWCVCGVRKQKSVQASKSKAKERSEESQAWEFRFILLFYFPNKYFVLCIYKT